jgi:hypothetical protein
MGNRIAKVLVVGFIEEVKHHESLAKPVLVKKNNKKWRMCVCYHEMYVDDLVVKTSKVGPLEANLDEKFLEPPRQ